MLVDGEHSYVCGGYEQGDLRLYNYPCQNFGVSVLLKFTVFTFVRLITYHCMVDAALFLILNFREMDSTS